MTDQPDIAAFLLAREDEREDDADEIHQRGCPVTFPYSMPCECGEPARVLADCGEKPGQHRGLGLVGHDVSSSDL